jgi:PD-(D/E)XK endonuclease
VAASAKRRIDGNPVDAPLEENSAHLAASGGVCATRRNYREKRGRPRVQLRGVRDCSSRCGATRLAPCQTAFPAADPFRASCSDAAKPTSGARVDRVAVFRRPCVRTCVRMFSTNQTGALAELEIAAAAVKLGVPVFRPLSEHSRADLVFEIGDLRVQCTWGRLGPKGDVVVVHIGGCWLSSRGYVRTTYTEDEMDLLAMYCGKLDRCYLLPASRVAGMEAIQLRLTPARNGQRACINLAEHFEFEGAIAQLGERLRGTQEVAGSSPASSTSRSSSDPAPVTVGSDPFRYPPRVLDGAGRGGGRDPRHVPREAADSAESGGGRVTTGRGIRTRAARSPP